MFQIQKKSCVTCIYKKNSQLNIKTLEDEIKDKRGFFKGYRACHHVNSTKVCCRGFWNKHKNNFQAGQIAQRLKLLEFVDIDNLK